MDSIAISRKATRASVYSGRFQASTSPVDADGSSRVSELVTILAPAQQEQKRARSTEVD